MPAVRLTLWLLLVLLVGSACSVIGDADEGSAVVLNCGDAAGVDNLDADGDGFTPCEGDCDDADPNASPAGVEESQTDGYDQDCDNFTFTSE